MIHVQDIKYIVVPQFIEIHVWFLQVRRWFGTCITETTRNNTVKNHSADVKNRLICDLHIGSQKDLIFCKKFRYNYHWFIQAIISIQTEAIAVRTTGSRGTKRVASYMDAACASKSVGVFHWYRHGTCHSEWWIDFYFISSSNVLW